MVLAIIDVIATADEIEHREPINHSFNGVVTTPGASAVLSADLLLAGARTAIIVMPRILFKLS